MSRPRKDAWTDFELQTLYEHVWDKDYLKKVRPLLPNRTTRTIQHRMTLLRKEAGINIQALEWGLEPQSRAG